MKLTGQEINRIGDLDFDHHWGSCNNINDYFCHGFLLSSKITSLLLSQFGLTQAENCKKCFNYRDGDSKKCRVSTDGPEGVFEESQESLYDHWRAYQTNSVRGNKKAELFDTETNAWRPVPEFPV